MICFALLIACSVGSASAKSLETAYEHPLWVLWGEQPGDESYQVRFYNSSVWASTNVTAFSENEAAEIGFGRIYRYIRGHNKREITMRMTVPVTVDIFQSACVFCPSVYTVSFYIPLIYQSDAPEPLDERILIIHYPDFIVYSRWFRNHRRSESYVQEAFELSNHLKENNVTTFATDRMALAAYDPPFKTFLRENEIWLFYTKAPEEEYAYLIEEYFGEEDEEGSYPEERVGLLI